MAEGKLTTFEMLREELEKVHGVPRSETEALGDFAALNGKLLERNAAALCLSGGGIRSAAFALGLIQGLARLNILNGFRYLSTVSGGGYIGSFLSAWSLRLGGIANVASDLARPPAPNKVEPRPIRNLRSDTNYLTPRVGLLSTDTWTGIAVYLRNLVLNWLVLLPFFAAAAEVPSVFVEYRRGAGPGHASLILAVGALALLVAEFFSLRQRPSWRRHADQGWDATRIALRIVAPGILWSFALALYTAILPEPQVTSVVLAVGIAYVLAYGIALLTGHHPGLVDRPPSRDKVDIALDFAAWLVAAGIAAGLVALGHWLAIRAAVPPYWKWILIACFGPLWVVGAHDLGRIVLVGLRSYARRGDDDREWLGRLHGWVLMIVVEWTLFASVIIFGKELLFILLPDYLHNSLPPVATLASGLAASLLGKSSSTAAPGAFGAVRSLPKDLAARILVPIFFILLLATLAHGADALAAAICAQLGLTGGWDALGPLIAILLLAAIGAIAAAFVNVNRFSLHALYRNRLIRAFLGSSNPVRGKEVDRFSDFNDADNLRMQQLWNLETAAEQRPIFHVVNVALNIVATKNLAWQERKAASFTITPLHCGSAAIDTDVEEEEQRGAYRSAKEYGGRADGFGRYGISLGTAITISGAAASPNMGYHSSPALALIMTLFNVRLGAWLGNPGKHGARKAALAEPLHLKAKRPYESEGPRFAALWLLNELLGNTTNESRFVYLSDGGHFENLALYEMMRRRCRRIIVSDAGCDPSFTFEDLGNAVRKVAIDLGIEIRIQKLGRLMPPGPGAGDPPRVYAALATIHYPELGPEDTPGRLLYVKPGYHGGDEPADVRAYAVANPTFPHESTADQWFSESQFEAYRKLGCYIVETAIAGPSAGHILGEASDSARLDALFAAAERYLKPANAPPDAD